MATPPIKLFGEFMDLMSKQISKNSEFQDVFSFMAFCDNEEQTLKFHKLSSLYLEFVSELSKLDEQREQWEITE